MSSLGITWQPRKVCVDQNYIYIAKCNDDAVVDYIPLLEIKSVVNKADKPPDTDQVAGACFGVGGGRASAASSNVKAVKRESTDAFLNRMLADEEEDDEEDASDGHIFIVQTIEGGQNSGRATVFLVKDVSACYEWVAVIDKAVKDARTRRQLAEDAASARMVIYQRRAREIYNNWNLQMVIGGVIVASYLTAMIGSQVVPKAVEGQHPQVETNLRAMEITFTIIFTAELLLNMFGKWFWPFFTSGWDVFDFLVVIVSIVSIFMPGLPAVNVLRLMRIFKMVRLFKQMTSLRILINALTASAVAVLNAFAILLLVTSLYAVVAADLFGPQSDLFVDFVSSMFTLFQVATGDSWASMVARTLMAEHSSGPGFVAIFFVSYVLIVGVVLMNIVVAVLLGMSTHLYMHTHIQACILHICMPTHTQTGRHTHTQTHIHTHTHRERER